MRAVRFTEWQNKRRTFLEQRARLGAKRLASSKIRDLEERAILTQLDKARFERWQKTGRLVRLAPRHYRLNISVPDQITLP